MSGVDTESILLSPSIVKGIEKHFLLIYQYRFWVELNNSQEWNGTYINRLFANLLLAPKHGM